MLIPVALFAYARPDHLSQTLQSLRANQVPLIYAFSDGARVPDKVPAVAEVRRLLRAIDWCDVRLIEREQNLGLGRSIRTGVAAVLAEHEAVIVVEDDLVSVPGAYHYLSAALQHYRDESKVMSVTGWTHPRVTPVDLNGNPYFDGRAECLLWGTWKRGWEGMDQDAQTLISRCYQRGIDPYHYGADLVYQASIEHKRNIWAVRFLYLHIFNQGLCLRPPYSLVEHIGFDNLATNAYQETGWSNPTLQPCPPIPSVWPKPVEHPACASLWRASMGERPPLLKRLRTRTKRMLRSILEKR
mgnify:CR=1 FL=1